jgi:hypothetical protein
VDAPAPNTGRLAVSIDGSRFNVDNVRLYQTPQLATAAAMYHISSSTSNDANNGLSPATAWQTFANANERTLPPGSAILLKRGDVWVDELNLRGSGSVNPPNYLGAYGTGPRPVVLRNDRDWDRCVELNNASCWNISALEGRFGSRRR